MGKKSKRQRPGKKAAAARAAVAAEPSVAAKSVATGQDREDELAPGGHGSTAMLDQARADVVERPTVLEDQNTGEEGDLLSKANRCKANFIRLTESIVIDKAKWIRERFSAIFQYQLAISAITNRNVVLPKEKKEMHIQDLAQHRKFLKTISESSEEISYVRALAYNAWAMICFHHCDFEDAAQCCHRAIEICQQATDAEKSQTNSWRDIASTLQQLEEDLARYRSFWAVQYSADGVPEKMVPFLGCDECEVCGKTYKELGLSMLECCSACQITYYCSRTCQTSHWKDHKQVCRKRGQFCSGDTATYIDSFGEIEQASLVKILENGKDDPQNLDRFLVVDQNQDKIARVDRKFLRRARPAIWTTRGGFKPLDDARAIMVVADAIHEN